MLLDHSDEATGAAGTFASVSAICAEAVAWPSIIVLPGSSRAGGMRGGFGSASTLFTSISCT